MARHTLQISLSLLILLLVLSLVAGCSPVAPGALVAAAVDEAPHRQSSAKADCPLTEPQWETPPQDSAIDGTSGPGYYFVNEDHSIWAGAWWAAPGTPSLRAGNDGYKTGWFRPAGAELTIVGRHFDSATEKLHTEKLHTHVPCCYPTRFQASGLYFPVQGCWRVTASAADSQLKFVVWVDP